MKILLFGSPGQLGTSIERVCRERHIDIHTPTRKEADITDAAATSRMISALRPNAVINATGIVDIQRCEADPALAFAVNATAARGLALACAESGAILVQTSTHLVYDGRKTTPYMESDLPCPNSVYAASKLAGECLALGLCPRTYVTRFPTLYGARRNSAQGFVEKMIERLRTGAPLRIADDRIDTPTWAQDAAEAVLGLLERNADYGLYHVANAGPVSYFDFIRHLGQLTGSNSTIERGKDADFPSSPPKPLRVPLTTTRMKPLRSWQIALAAYCRTLKGGEIPAAT